MTNSATGRASSKCQFLFKNVEKMYQIARTEYQGIFIGDAQVETFLAIITKRMSTIIIKDSSMKFIF